MYLMADNMKKLLFICLGVVMLSIAYAQTDNKNVLIGKSRNYGDSIVLRWNGNSATDFLFCYDSKIIIERKLFGEKQFIKIAEQSAIPLEKWGTNLNVSNQQVILAAGSLQNLLKARYQKYNTLAEQVEAYQSNQFLWNFIALASDLNPSVAKALNLRFTDKNISPKSHYTYRIYGQNAYNGFISDTLIFQTGTVICKPTAINQPEIIEREKQVEIQFTGDSKYSAYYLLKSSNKSNQYKPLNTIPILGVSKPGVTNPFLSYTDSLKQNYLPANYKVFAVDMFGDTSMHSKPVVGMGRDRTPPPIPSGLKVFENADKTLTIRWETVSKANGEKGLAVGLRHFDELPYEILNKELIPLSQTSYNLKINSKYNDYYFVLQVYDTAGNASSTEAYYLLNDSTGPSKPMGLKAIVNKKGVVRLSWKLNEEKDLDGYLIYFSNSPKTEFSGIMNKPYFDTLFYDTLSLGLLNKHVYYKIVAVDRRFNKSAVSDIIRVTRPDTLAPVAPSITKYLISDTAIQLQWIRSSSIDVVEQHIERTHSKSGKKVILAINLRDTFYSDTKIIQNDEYTYSLRAFDESKNISPSSNVISVRTYKNIFKPEVKVFAAIYSSEDKAVKLQWNYPAKNILRIQLYKGDSINTVTAMPAKVNPNSYFYLDPKVKDDRKYFYAIKLYFRDGTQTRLTVPIEVYIPKVE